MGLTYSRVQCKKIDFPFSAKTDTAPALNFSGKSYHERSVKYRKERVSPGEEKKLREVFIMYDNTNR